MGEIRPYRGVAAVVLALIAAAPAAAATYGDVDVTVESPLGGEATHGYAELRVRVANRSADRPREVRLALPQHSYASGDSLRAVTRTVTVEAGKTALVTLAYPVRHAPAGNGLGVTIDGRAQDEPVLVSGSGRGTGSYGAGYGPSGTPAARRLVLYSRSVSTRFPDWVVQAQTEIRTGLVPPAAVPVPHGRPSGDTITGTAECVRADQPVGNWSPHWLGYSRYDGVVVTAADLRTMPAEVRAALGQYVECGGSLLVLGRDATPPGPWKLTPYPDYGLSAGAPGFGQCQVLSAEELSDWDPVSAAVVLESWTKTAQPWRRESTPTAANRAFPVVADTGVPVKGLLGLMLVFAVVIGPVNLIVLTRMRRKMWLFWTVPVVSLVTCLLVLGYMAVTEGWQGRARIEGFTILDQNTRRASSLGWAGYYTPLLPGGGLHFSPDTEVGFQNGQDPGSYYAYRRRGEVSALTIDWTGDQHLASGWLAPRVPAHFVVRKSELRRERVTVGRGANGAPEAVNGLGADLTDLWYADEAGNLFHAQNVPAGERVPLSPAPRPAKPTRTLRDVYTGDWATLAERLKTDGPPLLAPRTYLAVMDAAPFLDPGLPGASVRKARSAVLGILKEGGDEG